MHQHSLDLVAEFRRTYLEDREKEALIILDIGSRDVNGSYREVLAAPAWQYVGVDLAPGENVDVVVRSPYSWHEFPSNYADVVVSGQTFEHVEFPWETMSEIARLLKPGGLCCIIAPSAGPEHRYPQDCWRIYPDGFAALARYVFLEVVETKTQWNDLPEYDEESNKWHDSVLIARKPCLPLLKRIRISLSARVSRRLRPKVDFAETTIQVFPMIEGSHFDEISFFSRMPPGKWQERSIALPAPTSPGPIRVDFVSEQTVIDLASIKVSGASGKTYLEASDAAAFSRFSLAGDAVRLPHERYLRLRITGMDPQVILPAFADELPAEPLVLGLRGFVHLTEP